MPVRVKNCLLGHDGPNTIQRTERIRKVPTVIIMPTTVAWKIYRAHRIVIRIRWLKKRKKSQNNCQTAGYCLCRSGLRDRLGDYSVRCIRMPGRPCINYYYAIITHSRDIVYYYTLFWNRRERLFTFTRPVLVWNISKHRFVFRLFCPDVSTGISH